VFGGRARHYLVLLCAVVSFGCNDLIGASDYSTAEPTDWFDSACLQIGGTACLQCARSHCKDTKQICDENPNCTDFAQCVATRPGLVAECHQLRRDFDAMQVGQTVSACFAGCAAPCGLGTNWTCIGAFDPESPDGNTSAKVLRQYSRFGSGGTPIAGLDVRACNRLDVDCAKPQDTATTDENGEVTLEVAWGGSHPGSQTAGFDGYLELTSQLIEPSWLPTLRFGDGNPIVKDGGLQAIIGNGRDPKLLALAKAAIGVDVDLTLSAVGVETHDCLGSAAPGVRFEGETDQEPVRFYYVTDDGVGIDPSLKETSAQGLAFAFNLKGSQLTVRAHLATTNERIGPSARTIPLRPGAAHAMSFWPQARGQ